MYKDRSILSIESYEAYGAVCFQLTYFYIDNYENICTSTYCHHQILNMNH